MRVVEYWALAGIAVPAAVIVIGWLQGGVFEWPYIALALWPSWILMGATYEREFTPFGILVFAISVGANVLLYSAVGAGVLAIFRRRRR